MSTHGNHQWPIAGQGQQSYMTEDDFSNFLDLENLDYEFPMGNDTSYDAQIYETNDNAKGTSAGQEYGQMEQYETCPPTVSGQLHQNLGQNSEEESMNGMAYRDYGASLQGGFQSWHGQQQFQPHMSVPPTPNSSGMYAAPYVQQLDPYSSYVDQRRGLNQLTPLTTPHFVSPGSSATPGYAVPETQLLSPLSSPAIYAQNGSNGGSSHGQASGAEEASTSQSADRVLGADGLEDVSNERPRKTRRKESVTQQSKPPAASTRRRKAAATASTKTASKAKTSTRAQSKDDNGSTASRAQSLTSPVPSYPSSVSPPAQMEMTMRPPPKPASAKSTPSIRPHSGSASFGPPPATPASLMRLSKSQTAHTSTDSPSGIETANPSTTDGLGVGMEELRLPEAAAEPPAPTSASISRTPRIAPTHGSTSARATPALLPRMPATDPTPKPLHSSPAAPFTNTSKNPNGRGGSRKRASTSTTSNLISPALRPRISPNIPPSGSLEPQPRTPQTQADDTHALLLASKSNYQNLLEGNTLPGVNYPSDLGNNLTSKRTSHKLAEQGRRNRINTALQEMQGLLAVSPGMEGLSPLGPACSGAATSSSATDGLSEKDREKEKDKNDAGSKTPATPLAAPASQSNSNSNSNNSKAATVELAIEYIRSLNERLVERDGECERLRGEVGSLRRKLGVGGDGEAEAVEGAAGGAHGGREGEIADGGAVGAGEGKNEKGKQREKVTK